MSEAVADFLRREWSSTEGLKASDMEALERLSNAVLDKFSEADAVLRGDAGGPLDPMNPLPTLNARLRLLLRARELKREGVDVQRDKIAGLKAILEEEEAWLAKVNIR